MLKKKHACFHSKPKHDRSNIRGLVDLNHILRFALHKVSSRRLVKYLYIKVDSFSS